MAKGPDTDSRERVSIVYKSQLTQSGQDVELPFKLLVMGNFSHSSGDTPLDERDPVKVTKENFDAVVKGLAVRIDLLTENRLAPEKQENLKVRLEFSSLADLTPKSLIRGIEPLAELAELSQALRETKKLLTSNPTLFLRLKEILADKDKKELLLKELNDYNKRFSTTFDENV
ncbi:MAG: type VI secretion system contractile sheath small subunit [Deltaproteobacteria bacterium]|jgi:type VI secretion system protein ImpB|nr:type VI secretion system contractile sheath small subunit [Deltaproteobacteria bacterium]